MKGKKLSTITEKVEAKTGKIIPDNGGEDFWGNPIPVSTTPSIGAYNREDK